MSDGDGLCGHDLIVSTKVDRGHFRTSHTRGVGSPSGAIARRRRSGGSSRRRWCQSLPSPEWRERMEWTLPPSQVAERLTPALFRIFYLLSGGGKCVHNSGYRIHSLLPPALAVDILGNILSWATLTPHLLETKKQYCFVLC